MTSIHIYNLISDPWVLQHHYTSLEKKIETLNACWSDIHIYVPLTFGGLLQDGVLVTNQALQKSGQPVIQKAEELQTTRSTLCNLSATIDHLQTCLPGK